MTELWAIKVPFDNDWLYVTEIVEGMDYHVTEVKVFFTKKEAADHSVIWGNSAKVVKYGNANS